MYQSVAASHCYRKHGLVRLYSTTADADTWPYKRWLRYLSVQYLQYQQSEKSDQAKHRGTARGHTPTPIFTHLHQLAKPSSGQWP